MAATARREIDTGEEDIAAIAKQISDHAEAIYQTWKARGLAPSEILSCRPSPGIKLADSLRTKPKPEPKPDIKLRPDIRQRPEILRENRPDARREQRHEPRREQRIENDIVETSLPPDLVPERNGTTAGIPNVRRADTAAMRLEVDREEERLMRALRTGGVVAERSAERPDVVPPSPVSLVDYAKSRYQDRLETGARKPSSRGASTERRASLGSHVTEARSKFEARARRASSAGTGEPAAANGATPVRPFLTRGSVAERVLMFERCPSEATLELAKRKTPAATTWRGPHDVINRAQPASDNDTVVRFCAGLIAGVALEAEITRVATPDAIRVRVAYPDRRVHALAPPTEDLRPLDHQYINDDGTQNLRLLTKVLVSHGVWTEPCGVDISICLTTEDDQLVELCKPVRVTVAPKPIKRGI